MVVYYVQKKINRLNEGGCSIQVQTPAASMLATTTKIFIRSFASHNSSDNATEESYNWSV